MKAYLTFCRINDDKISFIGINKSINIDQLQTCNISSGQPIVCILNDRLLGLYLIDNNGKLNQIYGDLDLLFQLKNLQDLSHVNLAKYNNLRHLLVKIFQSLSFKELTNFTLQLTELENKVFYNYLHTEIQNDYKKLIEREINKSNLDNKTKYRLNDNLKKIKSISNKLSNKKLQLDLSGYRIYVNTQI